MEYKNFQTEVISAEDREVVSLYSVAGHIDNALDRVMLGAFTKTLMERMDRVKVLWQHDVSAPPIGVPVELREVSRDELPASYLQKFPDAIGGLLGRVRYINTPRANEVLVGIKEGAITENSIGFEAIKFDFEPTSHMGRNVNVRNIRECRLWDISPVVWGMNDAARVLVKSAAFDYKDTGIVSETDFNYTTPQLSDFTDKNWSDLDDEEKMRIADHYTWAQKGVPSSFEDLKFPHHVASKSGVGPAVWGGVNDSMSALIRQEGKALSQTDKQGVYEHLVKHFEQFGKESPSWQVVEFSSLSGLLTIDEFKVGRVLSERNAQRLKDAISVLTDVLLEAEPQVDEEESEEDEPMEMEGMSDFSVVKSDSGLSIVTQNALTSSRRLALEVAIRERGLNI